MKFTQKYLFFCHIAFIYLLPPSIFAAPSPPAPHVIDSCMYNLAQSAYLVSISDMDKVHDYPSSPPPI